MGANPGARFADHVCKRLLRLTREAAPAGWGRSERAPAGAGAGALLAGATPQTPSEKRVAFSERTRAMTFSSATPAQ